jgi:GTP-binding protein Era
LSEANPAGLSEPNAVGGATASPFHCGYVAVVGRPNAGKSTLVNALVGEKVSIVTPAPQTTRNRILGIANRPSAQVILMDTPGIHKPLSRMNKQMMDFVSQALAERDLALLVVDASEGFGRGDLFTIDLLKRYQPRTILALNKIDQVEKRRLLPWMDRYSKLYEFEEIFPVSALKREGIEELMAAMAARLPEGSALFPLEMYTDQPEKFLAGEIIREKIILHTKNELPYVTAVIIESFEEERSLTRIHATLLVEKDSQKPIVIGAEGSRLKEIGTEARRDLEHLFPPQVYLEMHVSVERDWRNDPAVIRALDYRNEGLEY